MSGKTITVFGSSLPKPGEPAYDEAYQIGSLLGKLGYNVCTGGNRGIMQAVSHGAVDTGAQAIGITVHHFGSGPNPYVTRHIPCVSLFERIEQLVGIASGFIVLRGGTGTLLELAVVWEFMNKKLMPVKPVFCLDAMWENIVHSMEQQIISEGRLTNLVIPCKTAKSCVEQLHMLLQS